MKFSFSAAITLLLILLSDHSIGQTTFSFVPPMKIEQKLSANFGEVRRNHFHSGIDYRTESRTGIPVYAVEDGYISRVFVSSAGFGKALYINHKTSYTSVYAHLDSFTPEVNRYVSAEQYAAESFNVNLFPSKSQFIIKKGDLIGYSGNSGSSEGPHLHFEIRDQKTEEPLNPITINFLPIVDTIAPIIKSFIIYKIDSIKSIPNIKIDKEIAVKRLPIIDTLSTSKNVFFGIETFDQLPYSNNKYFINKISIIVDSQPFFEFSMERFGFNETRCVNSTVDYNLFSLKKREVIRMYKEPRNSLSLLTNNSNNGILCLKDSIPHFIEVNVQDCNGNRASYCCYVKRKKEDSKEKLLKVQSNTQPVFYWKDQNIIKFENETIIIPGSSIFNSFYLPVKEVKTPQDYSNTICIGTDAYPLKSDFDVSLKINRITTSKIADIAYICRKNNQSTYLGGAMNNGVLTAKSNEFGCFRIDVDSIPPSIKSNHIIGSHITPKNKVLIFSIKDNESGVEHIDAYIDGKWAITERDLKNERAYVSIDENRMSKNKTHLIEIYVSDKAGNIQMLKKLFIY